MPLIFVVTITIKRTRPHPQVTFRSFFHLKFLDKKIVRLLLRLGGFVQNLYDLVMIFSINPPLQVVDGFGLKKRGKICGFYAQSSSRRYPN
jgi:hypothetical protein